MIFDVKIGMALICAVLSCADKAKSSSEVTPCHNGGVSTKRTAEKLIITTCAMSSPCGCSSEEIVFADLKGEKGERGEDGARGPAGQNAADEVIDWCRHDPRDHVNRTVRVKISEAVKRFGGYNGALDYPGKCGETEGTCPCDSPVCNNPNSQVNHYFYEPEYD